VARLLPARLGTAVRFSYERPFRDVRREEGAVVTARERQYGVAFWLVSAVRGTGVLIAGGVLVLWCIFAVTAIRSDGFSMSAIGGTFLPALFWSFAGTVLTCYISIPAVTLVAGVIRIGHRRHRERAQQRVDLGATLSNSGQ
jgi:hypothetical protein